MMNLSRALLNALKRHGVRELSGIPDNFVLNSFKQVDESGILPKAFTLMYAVVWVLVIGLYFNEARGAELMRSNLGFTLPSHPYSPIRSTT